MLLSDKTKWTSINSICPSTAGSWGWIQASWRMRRINLRMKMRSWVRMFMKMNPKFRIVMPRLLLLMKNWNRNLRTCACCSLNIWSWELLRETRPKKVEKMKKLDERRNFLNWRTSLRIWKVESWPWSGN